MILLVDADSLIFASCYRTKPYPDDNPFYENLEDSVAKFDEQFMKIVNDLEELYTIEKVNEKFQTKCLDPETMVNTLTHYYKTLKSRMFDSRGLQIWD